MPRVRSQLAIQAPPELLERVRAAAAARGQTVTRLLIAWIEAGLAGELPAPGGAGLAERVAELEAATAELRAAVARLQAQPSRSPERVRPAVPPAGEPPSPERVSAAPRTGEALTTAELAERTGTNRAAWNNWASPERVGQVRSHPQAGPWRLVGQAPPPGGGPLRWLWEPA
jgi:hypothetical protein